jgi:predicted RNA-binding Zn-ribbon protein involved in translation (DUF1610 family)
MTEKPEAHVAGITVKGTKLTCSHCQGDKFIERPALLNTRGMTFMGWDWLNEGARVFQCSDCGHLEWFIERTTRYEKAQATEVQCLSCGNMIPPFEDRCKNCGWTYVESK